MDFWDVAKLMGRRWYVTVPMLVLTLLGAVAVDLTVKPDYKATGHITLIPPTVRQDAVTTNPKDVRPVNPWVEDALATTAIIRLQNKQLHDELTAEGIKGEWTASVEGRLPVITIEVVAATPDMAQRTVRRLLDTVKSEVEDRQRPYSLKPGEQITTVVLDSGENVEAVTSKLKRALVVVIGVGVIITMGLTVVLDAILRRRQARRKAPAKREDAKISVDYKTAERAAKEKEPIPSSPRAAG